MEEQARYKHKWILWLFTVAMFLGAIGAWFFFASPEPLAIKGTLKTKDGPVTAGFYDFRLKFYDATTRTDLVHSYDAHNVTVTESGDFNISMPLSDKLNIATLMQVCIASSKSAIPGTVSGRQGGNMLPSCEVPEKSEDIVYNQTICGVTAVEPDPNESSSWFTSPNVIYATPTKSCSKEGEGVATISGKDIVASLLRSPGSLASLLEGINLQPGTILAIDDRGELTTVPAAEVVREVVKEEVDKALEELPPGQITNVFNSYPTRVVGEPNTDNQTLSRSGNILSISGGNSVTLPSGSGSEQDGVIGNEITNVVSSSGLVRVGAGTTLDPFRVGLITCASGQVIKSTGAGTWGCATDIDTDTTYSAGTGISFSGTTINNTGVLSLTLPAGGGLTNTGSSQAISLKLQDCANTEILQYNAGAWTCVPPGGVSAYSFAITDTTTTQPITNGDTVTFVGNQGLLATVSATDAVTYGIVNGGVTNIKLANSSLTVSAGDGLSGGGAVALGASTTLNLQACSNGQILKHNGTSWACASDIDTNTTYSAGTGLSLVGTTFNNTGVLDVTGSGAITSSGGQNPDIAFADGSATGQFWQWDGDSWELATLAAEQDAVIGNEVTNVTGAASGLTRSGAGTAVSPYTLAANVGNGIQIVGNAIAVDSPTCSDTDKLQWTGTAFICSADVDTDTDAQTLSWVDGTRTLSISNGNSVVIPDADTNTTYSTITNGGIRLVGTQFGLAVCASGQILKAQPISGEYACAADNDTTYSAGTGLSLVGTTFSNTGVLGTTGSGAITSSGGQNPNIAFANGSTAGQFWQWDGDSWELATLAAEGDGIVGNEVVGVTGANSGLVRSGAGTSVSPYTLAVSVGNGLQLTGGSVAINSPTCAGTDKLQWNGTAFVCSADVDTNTDAQTLSWVDGTRTLSISNGNSVVIPDADTNTTYTPIANGGLRLSGTQFGLAVCTTGDILKAQAVSGEWACAPDADTNTTYSAGTGLSLVGTTFNNTGVLSVTGSGAITSSGGQNPNIAFANGSTAGQFWQWDGDSWELATLAAEQDSVIGNEVTNVTGAASGLTRSGAGTAVSPYTLAANVGNGIQITSNAIAINSPTCSGTDKLQWTGTAFVCSADVDTDTNTTYSAGNGLQLAGTTFSINSPTCAGTTKLQWNGTAFVCSADIDTNTDAQTLSWVDGTRTLSISGGNSVVIPDADTNTTYSALANGGLRLVGTEFGLAICTTGQILKAQATSGEWACAADTDTNTTYSAGTGLNLVGTTFNNTGVLGVTGSGAITSSGGQNPDIAFANGSVTGQYWQWDGDSWELATLTAEGDGIVGNEVVGVTGANSGLVRSGTGTAIDPYTLAVSVGNGLQLSSGSVAINSPTCAGTTKLQWNGTAFVCSADVDTDTTNFNITDGTTTQGVAATQAITFSGSAATKVNVVLGGTRTLTFSLDTAGASSGQVLTFAGPGLAWQTPTTYAAATCSISSTYFCQGGNTFGASATLGTNDAQSLLFETNNTTKMTILSGGNVGIGVSPTEKLDVNGNINIPDTSSTVGVIKQGGQRILHTAGGNTNFFAGTVSGNLTQTGSYNSGLGINTLLSNTDGFFNTAAGGQSLQNNTTGDNNSALGVNSLFSNISGNNNSAVGVQALQNNTGADNTAVGVNALASNTSGSFNIAFGNQAGYTSVSANANTTGSANTFIGYNSGPASTTQRQNSATIGAFSTVNQDNSLVLGCINGTNGCTVSTSVGISNTAPGFLLHVGSASVTTGTSVARFQNAGGTCTVTPNTAGGITCTSDERLKKNIQVFEGAIDIVKKIDIKKYNMLADADGTPMQIGVIAQQLETVLPGLVATDKEGLKSVSYGALAPVLLQAVKEQQVQLDDLKRNLWSGGIVTKNTTFKAAALFKGPARFTGAATFAGNVTFTGKIKLSSDQVNQVTLPAGTRQAVVTFRGAYSRRPYVTATPREFITGQYRVTKVKKTGFIIETEYPQSKDLRFDWHAFMKH